MLRIVLKEGKAIKATDDMHEFADEALEEISKIVEEEGDFAVMDKTPGFYTRRVMGPYGKDKLIGLAFSQLEDDMPAAKMGAREKPGVGTLIIIYYELSEDFEVLLPAVNHGHFIHELIHAFDPKLEKKISYVGMKDRNNKSFEEYCADPVEQDAYMRQYAVDIAKDLSRFPLKRVMEILRKKLIVPEVPGVPREEKMKIWASDERMWRKFINTVYDEVVSKRIPKQQPTELQKRLAKLKS